eukprot:scaffold16363_cov131-Cylindrotheca_fusiformis.AAC.3
MLEICVTRRPLGGNPEKVSEKTTVEASGGVLEVTRPTAVEQKIAFEDGDSDGKEVNLQRTLLLYTVRTEYDGG